MIRIKLRSALSLLKSIFVGIALGTLTVFAAYCILPKSYLINDDLIEPLKATCLIDTGNNTGTGVLLDTGYILTAGHVTNKAPKTRLVRVKFFNALGSVSSIHTGRVVYSSFKRGIDFGIIELESGIKSQIKLSNKYTKVGAELFTIGCQKGRAPHITYGKKSLDASLVQSRGSMTGWFGGSGGGVFSSSNEIVGAMVSVGIEARMAHVHAYLGLGDEDNFQLHDVRGNARYFDVIPNWSEYVDSSFIFKDLASKNLMQLIEVPGYDWNFSYIKFLLLTLLQTSGVLICVFYLRESLLG
jgi:hypothetical protein